MSIIRLLNRPLPSNHSQDAKGHSGFAHALKTFQRAAVAVPAYKDFLRKNKINPSTIASVDDFQRVPIMTKDNYLRRYSLKDLQVDGHFAESQVISMSSGSTGLPFFWPRGKTSARESADILDDLFARVFDTKRKETLCIIAYAMGTWIAGTYMLSAMTELTNRGHKFSTITPGINKDEIVQIFERIGNQFDQVLIMGYPPFIKDAIELAVERGIRLRDYNLKFMFSSEHISESWRDYVLDQVSPKYSVYNSLSLYGAADTGIIGMESPLLIHLRRTINTDKKLSEQLFPGTSILPTIVNIDPKVRYAEEVEGNIMLTLSNALPLIRYDMRDQGRVMTRALMIETVKAAGYQVPTKLLRGDPDWPLIALYGRADVAAMFYGVNIYPENVKSALEKFVLKKHLTGKFILKTEFDQSQEQSLHLYLEMRAKAKADTINSARIKNNVIASLRKVNSEYNKLHEVLGVKADPLIELKTYGSEGFASKIKHRWVVRS